MIEAEGVAKAFGSVRALDAVSLRVESGQAIGILGPNGSGKSTLFRVLAGFLRADAGRIVVAGVDLGSNPFEARERVGYLPERAPAYPELTVDRFLGLALDVKLPGADRRGERIGAAIERCGLEKVRTRRIGGLSKGYRQRVGIAQALLARPQVLILDEPTSGLDPVSVLELRALVRGLVGRTTVLLSSHILADVAATCDRVVMLDRGRTVLDARIDELGREVLRRGELLLRTRGELAVVRASIEVAARGLGIAVEIALEGEAAVDVAARVKLLPRGRTGGAGDLRAPGADSESAEVALADLAAEVARSCVAAGLPVLELGPRRQGLDELLAEILRVGQAAQSEALADGRPALP